MRRSIFSALAILTFATGASFAQTSPVPAVTDAYQTPPLAPAVQPPPPPQPIAPPSSAPVAVSPAYSLLPPPVAIVAPPEAPHVWFRGEVLAWWIKDAPLPVPVALVTSANGNTHTAIGNSERDFGAFGGGRLAFGAWFDQFNNYGFETVFFGLERRTNRQAVFSNGNGSPSIGLSYLSATPGQAGEFMLPLAIPNTFDGGVSVAANSQLWGAEINGAICLLRAGTLEFTTLAGFRYLELMENLSINSASTDLTTGDFFVSNDRFATRNQFYGGQLGARLNWQGNRLAFDAAGKIALGGTHQSLNIQGSSFTSTSDLLPGGFYAQPSNSGRFSANSFSVVPSLELKLSYQPSPWWRLFVGYDFVYWNNIARPGNQIDRNINLSQSAILGGGVLTGPSAPSSFMSRSDFWAQGITFGVEIRF